MWCQYYNHLFTQLSPCLTWKKKLVLGQTQCQSNVHYPLEMIAMMVFSDYLMNSILKCRICYFAKVGQRDMTLRQSEGTESEACRNSGGVCFCIMHIIHTGYYYLVNIQIEWHNKSFSLMLQRPYKCPQLCLCDVITWRWQRRANEWL